VNYICAIRKSFSHGEGGVFSQSAVTGHAKRRHNQQKIERENEQTKCQRFAKLKELQSQAQADTICSTFNFAQLHPSPPTTRLLDKFADC